MNVIDDLALRSPVRAPRGKVTVVHDTSKGRFVLRRRSPTVAEAKKLVMAIRDTPKISAYPVSAWMKGGALLAELEDGTVAGACLQDDFFGRWTEIAVLFVFEEFRGWGIGAALLAEARALLHARRRHVMIMSNNPLVTGMLPKHRFQILPSRAEFPDNLRPHRAALTWIYDLRWWMSAYRIREIIRKRRVFGRQPPYTYGLALAEDSWSVPPYYNR